MNSSAPFLLGTSRSRDAYQRKYWSGMIDEFLVYERAMGSSEIRMLFRTQK